MRPLHLTLTGFRSHRDSTDFDFSDRSLVAIVGPTGSGKSSILDGIAFALYGRSPREQRSTKRLICDRSDRAQVTLRFEVDGTHWEVTRSIARRGPSEHVLVDCSSGNKTRNESEVNAKIEELLGLDFGAFQSSVLLAQGRFDKFLSATPTERTKILKGLFRLERVEDIGRAAKERAHGVETEIAGVLGALNQISAGDEQLAEAKHAMAAAESRAKVLTEALPEEKRLLELQQGATEHIERLIARSSELTTAVGTLPAEDELEEFAREETRLQEALAEAGEAVQAMTKLQTDAAKAYESLKAGIGTEVALATAAAEAAELASARKRIAAAGATLTKAEAGRVKADTAVRETERSETEARAAVESATAERIELESSHRAHVLREHLVKGEPCPVCEQEVATIPKAGKLPGLASVRKAEEKAEAAHSKAQKALAEATSAATKAASDLRVCRRDLATYESDATARTNKLVKLLGKIDDPVEEIERRRDLLEASSGSLTQAVTALEQANKVRDAAKDEIESRAATRRKMFGSVTSVSTLAKTSRPEDDSPSELVGAAGKAREAIDAELAKIVTELDERRRSADETTVKLAGLREGFDLEPGTSIADAKANAQADKRVAESEVDRITKALAERKKLTAKHETLTKRKATFDSLVEDMRPSNFVAYLLEERNEALAELASVRFRAMSGRYRFAIDERRELVVLDELAADAARAVSSLSGGETFLASLALALSLAELVTREGGRLQCFFLDEGFGSLDAESFDMAMDGIEALVTEDRLIGLVSHVEALKARVEDKIVLGKAADGTTIVEEDPGDLYAAIANT